MNSKRAHAGLLVVGSLVALIGALMPALMSGGLVNAAANVVRTIPDELNPPIYTSALQTVPDGVFFLDDGVWVVIPFVRDPSCIRPDFNLFELIDPAAPGCALTIRGFAVFADQDAFVPAHSQFFGLGAVPVWFVRREELEAMGNSVTITQLAAMASLRIGTATFYHESDRLVVPNALRHGNAFGGHIVLQAVGTLEDGGSFRVLVSEGSHVSIRFE
jgi:hypothetical protein